MRCPLCLFVLVCLAALGGGCGGSVSPTPPPHGTPCAFDDQCAGARCSAAGDGCGVCVSAKKVVGQTCALGLGGLLPVDQKECDDELYCQAPDVTARSGICRAPLGMGEACSLFAQCESGLRCVDDTCVSGPGKLGEPCGPYPGCADDTLECDSLTTTCQTGTLALGEACGIVGAAFIDRSCAPPNVCWATNGLPQTICVTPPGEGEPCARYECAAPLFCRTKNDGHDTCERPRNEGEPCVQGGYGAIPCATGLECRGSVCHPACR